MRTMDPATREVVEVTDDTRIMSDPTSPTHTRMMTEEEIRVADERMRRTKTIVFGTLGALAVGGYLWKGWKGAVAVPGITVGAFIGLAVVFGQR